ncbi:hypothetical protein STCU_11666 [Strigomonas culicis]|uniref:Uncharacterized protein n=1 Tax=Strigomonas culicis TaxID=28005 RepID=S9UZD7_9TRYP|nr:hypothetical protein STCU_11666 [Strigomonas culicis]|eukprot:EPY15925.1 hypothetical protein STCU_11666 [Strigomonas culicis]
MSVLSSEEEVLSTQSSDKLKGHASFLSRFGIFQHSGGSFCRPEKGSHKKGSTTSTHDEAVAAVAEMQDEGPATALDRKKSASLDATACTSHPVVKSLSLDFNPPLNAAATVTSGSVASAWARSPMDAPSSTSRSRSRRATAPTADTTAPAPRPNASGEGKEVECTSPDTREKDPLSAVPSISLFETPCTKPVDAIATQEKPPMSGASSPVMRQQTARPGGHHALPSPTQQRKAVKRGR